MGARAARSLFTYSWGLVSDLRLYGCCERLLKIELTNGQVMRLDTQWSKVIVATAARAGLLLSEEEGCGGWEVSGESR